MSTRGSLWRDANHNAIQVGGVVSRTSMTLSGNNTTVATPLFRVTGAVEVNALYGVVTTALGSNVTAAYLRLNDQTAQVDITLSTGATLSSSTAGSTMGRRALAATAMSLQANSAGRISEQATSGASYYSPFLMVQKTGGINTDIEFVYTTTNTPTSGVIQFFAVWLPISADGKLTVI